MPSASLTSKGQLVIPKAIRDHLGLHTGDVLDFVLQDNGDVLIRPVVQDVRGLKGILHMARQRPVTIEEMNRAIRRRRKRRR